MFCQDNEMFKLFIFILLIFKKLLNYFIYCCCCCCCCCFCCCCRCFCCCCCYDSSTDLNKSQHSIKVISAFLGFLNRLVALQVSRISTLLSILPFQSFLATSQNHPSNLHHNLQFRLFFINCTLSNTTCSELYKRY